MKFIRFVIYMLQKGWIKGKSRPAFSPASGAAACG
jgi:hypothetical protein